MSPAIDPVGAPLLRLGTRGSALALAQSGMVARQLAELAAGSGDERVPGVELVRIKTEGDVNQGPLAQIGGTGVFVGAVRTALADGRVDVVVHSYKDLPTAPADGIVVGAVPVREDPADVLCARDGLTVAGLPTGARVGTGSPRRSAQLRALRPDVEVVPVRGNVDTRLRLVTDGHLDAVVLAASGLARLDRSAAITERLRPEDMLPACGQGALAVECRTVDRQTAWYAGALNALDDPATRAAADAERSLLAAVEAGCVAPVGAHATVDGATLRLTAAVFSADGQEQVRGSVTGPLVDAVALGVELAEDLLTRGAGRLLAAPR
ncbi:hydroxymethylbilane synthase [Nakamurella flava]|uniref:hydroxymethylbilane synthase n=1 Tax=Nakamurella flava TaxID=2576308 RepID=UPI001F0F09A2|nr:hydroxymethylbilane synthase [Nakamurella flava]